MEKYKVNMLRKTLQHAINFEYYKNHWSDFSNVLNNIDMLSNDELIELFNELPITNSDALDENGIAPITTYPICSMYHTTGSTGRPKWRYVNTHERELISQLNSRRDNNDYNGNIKKIGLNLYGTYHSNINTNNINTANASYTFQCSVFEERLLASTAELLKRKFAITSYEEQISYILAEGRLLKVLTNYLIRRKVKKEEMNVKLIVLYACYPHKELVEYLQAYWGVKVVNSFSFSEFNNQNMIVNQSGKLLIPPLIHAEIDGDSNKSNTKDKFGRIIFTQLYPYGYTQPLIKYFAGDIGKSVDDKGIMQIGREKLSLFKNDNNSQTLLFPSNELRDLLYFNGIKRTNEFPQLNSVVDNSILGAPMVEILQAQDEIIITYSPSDENPATVETMYERYRALCPIAFIQNNMNRVKVVFKKAKGDLKECRIP